MLTLTKTGNAVKVTDSDSAISFVNPKVSWIFAGNILKLDINSSHFEGVIGEIEIDGDTQVNEGGVELGLSSVFPSAGGAATPTLQDVLTAGNNAGNFKITNLGDATADKDAVNKQSVLGYTSYVALLTQTGVNPPEATILKNTLFDVPVWSYTETGTYKATLAGMFPADKTLIFIGNRPGRIFAAYRINDDAFEVTTQDDEGSYSDGYLSETAIEMRVYP